MIFKQYKREKKKNQLHSIQGNTGNNDTLFVITLYADIYSIQRQLCVTNRYQFGV